MNRLTRQNCGAVLIALASAVSTACGGSPAESPRNNAAATGAIFNADAEYDKGETLAAEGQLDEALALFQAAATRDPSNAPLAAAVAVFRDMDARRVSRDAVRQMFRATSLANIQRWKEAHAAAEEAVKLAPRYARAHDTQAKVYSGEGRYAEAMKSADRAIALDSTSGDSFYLRGMLNALQAKWADAEADLTRAIERDPSHAQAYYDRGLARQNQGKDELALADWTKAIELEPANAAALINRGLLFARRKQYDQAIADYDKALAADPTIAIAVFNKALALEQTGRTKEAVAAYRAFLQQLGPGDAAIAAQARERLAAIEK